MPNFMLLKERKLLAALLLIFFLAGCGEKKEKVVTIPEATFAITEGVANWSGELKDRLQAVSSAHRIIFLTLVKYWCDRSLKIRMYNFF